LTPQIITPENILEEILKVINTQVLETKYVINLEQVLKIVSNIKQYIFKFVKSIQSIQLEPIQPKHTYAIVAIGHQMAMTQVQVGKSFIDDVLIDGGSKVNIMIENLKVQLGLSKPNLTPYNLRMVD
jgi:hypothetical protein